MEREYGSGYILSELLERKQMPDLYYKILKEIEFHNWLEQKISTLF